MDGYLVPRDTCCTRLCHTFVCLHTSFSGGRYKVVDKGLQITNVTENDNGDYTCRAEVEAEGRYDERRLSLIVHSKSLFIVFEFVVSLT
jgi:Immunoglobulin I-set domain